MKKSSARPGERRGKEPSRAVPVEAALKWIVYVVLATYLLVTAFVVSRSSSGSGEATDPGRGSGSGTEYDLEGLLLEGLPSKPRHTLATKPFAPGSDSDSGSGSGLEARSEEEGRAVDEALKLLRAAAEAEGQLRLRGARRGSMER